VNSCEGLKNNERRKKKGNDTGGYPLLSKIKLNIKVFILFRIRPFSSFASEQAFSDDLNDAAAITAALPS